MLAELVGKLGELAVQAAAVQFVKSPHDPRLGYVVEGGSARAVPIPAPLRAHSTSDLASLLAFVCDEAACPEPEVWVHAFGGVALCSRADRRERIELEIPPTDRWDAVVGLGQARAMSPRDAVRFLRFTLDVRGADALLAGLGRIDFVRSSSASHRNEHGAESLGRSVEAKVQRVESIPDVVTLTVPVHQVAGGYEATVRIGVEIDAESQLVRLVTMPDECGRALQAAEAWLCDSIRTSLDDNGRDGVPVYRGSFAGGEA